MWTLAKLPLILVHGLVSTDEQGKSRMVQYKEWVFQDNVYDSDDQQPFTWVGIWHKKQDKISAKICLCLYILSIVF